MGVRTTGVHGVTFVAMTRRAINWNGQIHMDQSNDLATRVENEHPEYTCPRSYLDAYQQYSSQVGSGIRMPRRNCATRAEGRPHRQLHRHGGEVGWAMNACWTTTPFWAGPTWTACHCS
jgi:hypothetical protein